MKKYIGFVFIFVASACFADAELDALIDRLQQRYDSVQSMSAKFEQRYSSVRFDDDKKASGILEIQKPGKMRWDYSTPKGKLLVSDGETLSLYDPSDKQVIMTHQPKADNLPAAISFLSGKGKLKESFQFSWIQKPSANKAIVKAVPKKPEPNVREVHFTITVDGEPTIVGTSIVDELGGQSTLTFSQIKVNPTIASKRFSFKAPQGVTVVRP